jgi:hypothetical protein
VRAVSAELIADRPRIKRRPSAAPGGRSVPAPGDPATEVKALATLLAEVVEQTGDRAVFPGRWAQVAKLVMEHDSVRRALLAEEDSR